MSWTMHALFAAAVAVPIICYCAGFVAGEKEERKRLTGKSNTGGEG